MMPRPLMTGGAGVESVTIRTPRWVVAVRRRPNGGLVIGSAAMPALVGLRAALFVRGFAAVAEALWPAVSASAWTVRGWHADAERAALDEGEPAIRYERITDAPTPADTVSQVVFLLVLSFVPQLAADGVLRVCGVALHPFSAAIQAGAAALGLFGLVAYWRAIRGIPEVVRVYRYNSAFLRLLAAWDSGGNMTPQNVAQTQPLHPRAGTLFLVALLPVASAMAWSFGLAVSDLALGWGAQHALAGLVRALSYPVSAAVVTEASLLLVLVGRLVGGFHWMKVLLPCQNLALAEPDDSHIAVACAACAEALRLEAGGEPREDSWKVGAGDRTPPELP